MKKKIIKIQSRWISRPQKTPKQNKEFSTFYTKKLLGSVQLGADSGASTNLLIGYYIVFIAPKYRTIDIFIHSENIFAA